MYTLQEIDSDSDPIRILLREKEEVIGTKTISSLKRYPQISKKHCIIYITKDRIGERAVYIKEFSNSPGVFVNGVRVGTELLLLHEGDIIGLGVPNKDGRKGFICKFLSYEDKLYSYESGALGSASDSSLEKIGKIDLNCADDKSVSPDIVADKFDKSITTENTYKMPTFEEFTLETFHKVPPQSKKEHHVSSHEKRPSSSDVSNIPALNGSSQGVNRHKSLNRTSTDSSYRNDNEETMLLEENVESNRGRRNCNFQGSLVQSFNPNNKVTIVDIHKFLRDSPELSIKACNKTDKEDMRNTILGIMDLLKKAHKTDRDCNAFTKSNQPNQRPALSVDNISTENNVNAPRIHLEKRIEDFNRRSGGSVNVHGNGSTLDFNPRDNSPFGDSEVPEGPLSPNDNSHKRIIREIFGDSCSSISLSSTKSSPRRDNSPEAVESDNGFIQPEDNIPADINSDAADGFRLTLINTKNNMEKPVRKTKYTDPLPLLSKKPRRT